MHQPSVLFNFGNYCYPEWVSITRREMFFVYQSVQRLVDTYEPEVHAIMLHETECELIEWIVDGNEPDEEWIITATLIVCLRGILYGEIPDTLEVTD